MKMAKYLVSEGEMIGCRQSGDIIKKCCVIFCDGRGALLLIPPENEIGCASLVFVVS
jgi:hypothetical protein